MSFLFEQEVDKWDVFAHMPEVKHVVVEVLQQYQTNFDFDVGMSYFSDVTDGIQLNGQKFSTKDMIQELKSNTAVGMTYLENVVEHYKKDPHCLKLVKDTARSMTQKIGEYKPLVEQFLSYDSKLHFFYTSWFDPVKKMYGGTTLAEKIEERKQLRRQRNGFSSKQHYSPLGTIQLLK